MCSIECGCGGSGSGATTAAGQDGSPPADAGSDADGAPSRDISAFGDLLTKYSSSHYEPPANLEQVVASSQIALVGELVDVTSGRKEYLGGGCGDPSDGGLPCNPSSWLYASYVDLVVKPEVVLKGSLEDPSSSVHIEHPWPNNLDIDALEALAPTGHRVIVLGDRVQDARDQARPLEEAGILPPGSVASNLVAVAPYGLLLENDRGETVLPLAKNRAFHEITSGDDQFGSFDDVVSELPPATAATASRR